MRYCRQGHRVEGDPEAPSPTAAARPHTRESLRRSVVSDSATPWTAAHQAPLSTGFSGQGYWSGLSFPSPGDLPEPHIYASIHFYLPGQQSGELKDTGRETRLPGFKSQFRKTREPWALEQVPEPPVLRAWPVMGRTPMGNGVGVALPRRYSPGHMAGAPPPPGSRLPALPPTPPSKSVKRTADA